MGGAIGGLLIAGFLRLMIQYHSTFSINSVAYTNGRQPCSTAMSARDSYITAVPTQGEGYPNYHHRFPGDYRNGIRFFHFDPTKWWIWLMSRVGMARHLRRVPREVIQGSCPPFPRKPQVRCGLFHLGTGDTAGRGELAGAPCRACTALVLALRLVVLADAH